jgi:hypothetical protein
MRRRERIVSLSNPFGEAVKRRLDLSVHLARAALAVCPQHLLAYDSLLAVVYRNSTLLARRGLSGGPDVHAGIVQLATHAADWIRPVGTWRCPARSRWVQFASLAEHLLAHFAMPRFMASVWLVEPEARTTAHQDWYKRLGRGESIRRMGLPIRLTRAMARRFLCAPHHLSATEALRWAQVLGLGGSPMLAAAVTSTRLGRELANEGFWETVVRFLVNNPDLDLAQVGPIIDYLHHQRFEGVMGIGPSGEYGPLPPRQPEFSMKGRTTASLMRLVAAWHRELGRTHAARVSWRRSEVQEFESIERVLVRAADDVRTEMRVWSIRELCSAEALRADGSAMHHCVAMYAYKCLSRRSSIWSMQVETQRGRRRVLTIEVDRARRRVVQARRKCNALPSEAERAILLGWARREGLAVDATFRA